MYLCKSKNHKFLRTAIILLILTVFCPFSSYSQEFGASVAPPEGYLIKFYPKVYLTSAYFSDKGKALNLTEVTQLIYIETPVYIQYGLTNSISVGVILPPAYSYQEILPDLRWDPIDRYSVKELWLTLQHRYLTFLTMGGELIAASSIRIKIPLAKKKDWEDGLRVGDDQFDIYPVYYFDYSSKAGWYTENAIGYKFRLKKGSIKPFDELTFRSELGFELFPAFQFRTFIYTDMTRFRNGEFSEDNRKFFENEGSLHTWGYGVSIWPSQNSQIYIATGGDWSGRNQYRGMHWTVGLTLLKF
ncbi:hypothetical protein ACFL7D_07155 [candidate division KSB1 bacterium]